MAERIFVCNVQILWSARSKYCCLQRPNTVVSSAKYCCLQRPNTVVSSAKYCNVFITPKYCCQQRPIKILLSAAPNTVVCNVQILVSVTSKFCYLQRQTLSSDYRILLREIYVILVFLLLTLHRLYSNRSSSHSQACPCTMLT